MQEATASYKLTVRLSVSVYDMMFSQQKRTGLKTSGIWDIVA
jgi:hypothetical protein